MEKARVREVSDLSTTIISIDRFIDQLKTSEKRIKKNGEDCNFRIYASALPEDAIIKNGKIERTEIPGCATHYDGVRLLTFGNAQTVSDEILSAQTHLPKSEILKMIDITIKAKERERAKIVESLKKLVR